MCLTINFTEEENRLLNSYAKVHSTSVSDAIKKIVLEKIEDEYDAACAENAYKAFIESGKKTYSFSEAMEELGL